MGNETGEASSENGNERSERLGKETSEANIEKRNERGEYRERNERSVQWELKRVNRLVGKETSEANSGERNG